MVIPGDPKAEATRLSTPAYSAIPPEVLKETADIMVEGAQRYSDDPHNPKPFKWREVAAEASTYWDAAIDHLEKWRMGEYDHPIKGGSHLTRAIAHIIILRDLIRQPNFIDNRHKKPPKMAARLVRGLQYAIDPKVNPSATDVTGAQAHPTKTRYDFIPPELLEEIATTMMDKAREDGKAFKWHDDGEDASDSRDLWNEARTYLGKWWNGEGEDAEENDRFLLHALRELIILRDSMLIGKIRSDEPSRTIHVSAATDLHGVSGYQPHDAFMLRDTNPFSAILSSLDLGDRIVEIGTGDGALTSLLAGDNRVTKKGTKVVGIEIDHDTAAGVRDPDLTLLWRDFHETDMASLIAGYNRASVVSNPPYNLLPLIRDRIEEAGINTAVLMTSEKNLRLFKDLGYRVLAVHTHTDFEPNTVPGFHYIIAKAPDETWRHLPEIPKNNLPFGNSESIPPGVALEEVITATATREIPTIGGGTLIVRNTRPRLAYRDSDRVAPAMPDTEFMALPASEFFGIEQEIRAKYPSLYFEMQGHGQGRRR